MSKTQEIRIRFNCPVCKMKDENNEIEFYVVMPVLTEENDDVWESVSGGCYECNSYCEGEIRIQLPWDIPRIKGRGEDD